MRAIMRSRMPVEPPQHRVGVAVGSAEGHADQVEVLRRDGPHGGAVVVVVARGEHLGGVERDRDSTTGGPLADGLELPAARLEDEDGLDEQREVAVAVRVEVVLADGVGPGGADHAAHQKRGDVEPLPHREVLSHDHRGLGVEVGDPHSGHRSSQNRRGILLAMIEEVLTERVRLRPLTAGDFDALYATVFSDPEVSWTRSTRPEQEGREALEAKLAHVREHGFGMMAVTDRETGKVLGYAGLQHLENGPDVEVGYYLGRGAWGRGLGSEIAP